MHIEYVHASKFGNGAIVAEDFARRMAARGVDVHVQHIRDTRPDRLPAADLYVFSAPGRMGRPVGGMRRFLKRLRLPAGARYALLTTEAAPARDTETGVTTEAAVDEHQRVRPIMHELLQAAGLVGVAEGHVFVTAMKGPLEDGWQDKVEAFAARIPLRLESAGG